MNSPSAPLLGRWLLSFAIFAAYFVLLTGLRVLFVAFHDAAAASIPPATLHQAYLIGMRFDAAIAAYGALPALGIVALADPVRYARLVCLFSAALMVGLVFLAVIELDFYSEFHQRLNDLAFVYLLQD